MTTTNVLILLAKATFLLTLGHLFLPHIRSQRLQARLWTFLLLALPIIAIGQLALPQILIPLGSKSAKEVSNSSPRPTIKMATTAPKPTEIAPDELAALAESPTNTAHVFLTENTPRKSLPWLLIAYGVGVALLSLRSWFASLRHRSVKKTETTDPKLLQAWSRLFPNTKAPAIRLSDSPLAPYLAGFFRPVIVLPTNWHQWSSAELRATLAHEATHIRHHDLPARRFSTVVCTLFWFHPFVWLAHRRLVLAQEQACDESVLRTKSLSAPDYADWLLQHVAPTTQLPAPAMAAHSQLSRRITRILNKPMKTKTHPIRSAAAATLAFLTIATTILAAPPSPPKAVEKIGSITLTAGKIQRSEGVLIFSEGVKLTGPDLSIEVPVCAIPEKGPIITWGGGVITEPQLPIWGLSFLSSLVIESTDDQPVIYLHDQLTIQDRIVWKKFDGENLVEVSKEKLDELHPKESEVSIIITKATNYPPHLLAAVETLTTINEQFAERHPKRRAAAERFSGFFPIDIRQNQPDDGLTLYRWGSASELFACFDRLPKSFEVVAKLLPNPTYTFEFHPGHPLPPMIAELEKLGYKLATPKDPAPSSLAQILGFPPDRPEQIFSNFDKNNDYSLDLVELKQGFKNESQAEAAFIILDKNQDGKLMLSELYRAYRKAKAKPAPVTLAQEMGLPDKPEQFFNEADVNGDFSISLAEFQESFNNKEQAAEVFVLLDKNQDKRLVLSEIYRAYRQKK